MLNKESLNIGTFVYFKPIIYIIIIIIIIGTIFTVIISRQREGIFWALNLIGSSGINWTLEFFFISLTSLSPKSEFSDSFVIPPPLFLINCKSF